MNPNAPHSRLPANGAALSPGSTVLRLAIIGAIVVGIAGAFAYTGGWLTPHRLTPTAIVDRFEKTAGLHPGFRRNHAKGVCVSGYFESNGQGAALSKATVFQAGRVPVLGRYSLGGGQPDTVDSDAPPHGLGLRFAPPGGEEWRTAMIDLPVFPFSTPEAFYEQLVALAPDPATGKPNAASVQAFLARYPASARALEIIRSQPKSSGFANSPFHSLNAFRFTNAAGQIAWVRWSLQPLQPFEPAASATSNTTDKNRLFDALIAALHDHPLQWRLLLTVAEPGDSINDATLPWPSDRRTVDAGTITLDHIESDDTSPARDLNFDPLILPDGIAPSDDPLLSARSATYSRSFTRREGEPKSPSAISPAATAR
jgi:catalase